MYSYSGIRSNRTNPNDAHSDLALFLHRLDLIPGPGQLRIQLVEQPLRFWRVLVVHATRLSRESHDHIYLHTSRQPAEK